jgi:peptidoglycan/LPS O-acetylase OafA/YrhL
LKKTLDALTGLRFLAAFHVLVFHTGVADMLPRPLSTIASRGPSSVGLFFILSGFVLAYADRFDDRRKFYWARFARVYPLYLLGLLVALPMVAADPGPKPVPMGTLVLGLLQAWLPGVSRYWNCVAWSLSAEAFFYAVFPPFAAYARRLDRRQLVAAIGVLWLLSEAPVALYRMHPTTAFRLDIVVEFNPLLRLPEFLIGICAGRLFLLGLPRVSGAVSVAAAISALAILTTPAPAWAARGVLTLVWAALVFSLAAGEGPLARLLSRRPAILLGESSYALYILHVPMFYLLYHAFTGLMGDWTLILGADAIIVALSIAAHKLVELPARRWLLSPPAPRRTIAGSLSCGG